jgi:hypothetical protein
MARTPTAGGLAEAPGRPQPAAGAPAAPAKAAPASPKDQSKAIADTVIGSLVQRLMAEAERRGGYLHVRDLQAMSHEFARQAEALQKVFEQSFEAYVKARERAAFDQTRNYPFDRVIVRRFAHHFADDKTMAKDRDALSRRMLPGFFMALNMMVGAEVIEGYQERCRKIVDRLRKGREEAFTWAEVYADREADDVALDALVHMAPYFADVDKREAWFVGMVNGHLTPVDAPSPASGWQLTPAGFRRFVRALFGDLSKALADAGKRQELVKRHGADAVQELSIIVKGFG